MNLEYVKTQMEAINRIKKDIFENLDEAAMVTMCCAIIDHVSELSGRAGDEIAADIGRTVMMTDGEILKEIINKLF